MEEEREKDSASQETPETEKPEENKVSEEKAGELGSGDSTVKKIVGLATAIRVTEETLSDGKTRAVSFEVEALPGEGRTHLARRAIREQSGRANIALSPEQKIFAEDFLQKNFAPKTPLHPGSTITFSADQVNEALEAAQNLNPAQIQNLTKWANLVSWPP